MRSVGVGLCEEQRSSDHRVRPFRLQSDEFVVLVATRSFQTIDESAGEMVENARPGHGGTIPETRSVGRLQEEIALRQCTRSRRRFRSVHRSE